MKAVIALLLGVSFACQSWREDSQNDWDRVDHVSSWNDWKVAFNKEYVDLQEESYRFLQFLKNWEFINEHNQAGYNYTLGMNQFSDLNVEEFQYHVHGHQNGCLQRRDPKPTFKYDPKPASLQFGANPDAVDWTNVNGQSYVTAVKDQGQCGSCWAFSSTGSLESRYAIANKQTGNAITTLSEQELVDCSKAQGNQGCNGGLMDDAFKYVQKANGLCSESEYKYTARDGTCKASSCGTHYDAIKSFTDVKSNSESSLETAVVAGPVSVAVDAMGTTWQFYKSGIVDGHCGVMLDHGVLAVGYGISGSEKYWKVKNSWGPSWGMKGYILLCKDCGKNGDAGECGINREPSYPNY
jgi:KDEL-tailed cysteine endopeptidase